MKSTTLSAYSQVHTRAAIEAAGHRKWRIVEEVRRQRDKRRQRARQAAGLQSPIKDGRVREIDVVAVWSVNCLGRSSRHLVGFLEELDGAGCDLYLHQQSLDTRRRRVARCSRCSASFPNSSGRSFAAGSRPVSRERVFTDQKAASRLGSSRWHGRRSRRSAPNLPRVQASSRRHGCAGSVYL